MLCNVKANVCIIFLCWLFFVVKLYNIKLIFNKVKANNKKTLASLNLQELY